MTRICVIGAGPVGTTMTLALVRAGFDTMLIEREQAPPDDPRAATLQPPTLAMLSGLGSGAEVIERGLKARHFQFRDRSTDDILAEFDYGLLADQTDHPFALQCEQVKVASANLAAIRTEGCATLRLGTEMRDIAQDADGVTVRFAAGCEEERLCYTNPVKDSSRESGVVAGIHEQTDTHNLQDHELASL